MRDLLTNPPVSFGRPGWLLVLLVLVPVVLWLSRQSLSGLGRFRGTLAIALRIGVVTLLVLALADLRSVRRSETLTALFLLDASESIPGEWHERMFDFVNRAKQSKSKRPGDLAGVIAFGREARVEVPPVPDPPTMARFENRLETDHTDVSDALKLALATLPEDSARRIVVLSDGNENRGRALDQALAAAGLNVQIDVVPIEYRYDDEVLVEKVTVPPDVKQGDTVELNVVFRAAAPTRGKLQIFQRSGNYQTSVTSKPIDIELDRGLTVKTLKQTITEPNFYTFTAEFLPEEGSGDRRRINNSAEGFVYARGAAHVLLIEGKRGEHDELAGALRSKRIQVTTLVAPGFGSGGVETGDPIPSDLAELQLYDAVILANVPKDAFTEQQMQLLELNCHDLGAGLIMLGGPNSFGAGRWNRTPIERALPVDMDIKDQKVVGKSALVMVMHATEIPEGNYWQKVIAKSAIETLSPYDEAGLLHWLSQEAWLFTLQPVGDRKALMLRQIDRMTPGDMPDFGPMVMQAANALRRSDAMTKHCILISDGDPTPPTAPMINQLKANKITVTTVLVAAHGGDMAGPGWMQPLAQQTGGRFYKVDTPQALPRIYQKEVRLISRPLIYEQQTPWKIQVNTPNAGSELIAGLHEDAFPPISGIVLSSRKENPLVEIPLVSPQPKGQFNPLLAHWTYGLGRAVAFTSDAGPKWTTTWPSWESYAAFWWQVVRWSLRPVDDRNLSLSLRREGDQIQVVVDALDKDERYVNFLQFQGMAVSPELDAEGGRRKIPITMVQTAPGRYEGTLDHAATKGSYFLSLGYVGPDGKTGLVSGGVAVPYSEEYRELHSNAAALEALAEASGGRVQPWLPRSDQGTADLNAGGDGRRYDVARTVAQLDPFRRDPSITPPPSTRALWPSLLWWCCLLFLGDVAARRLAPDVARWRRSLADGWKALRGQVVPQREEYMEKLQSRSAAVREELARARAGARFEAPPGPEPPPAEPPLGRRARAAAVAPSAPESSPRSDPSRPARPASKPIEPAAASHYTDRLLKAKQKVWEERRSKEVTPDPNPKPEP
jgi:uncharacterized membrane protein/Mg-chelatase subunit ChlD